MANFTDLLGTLIKAGMSPSSVDRTTSALGGRDGLGALTDLLGQVMGGSRQSGAAAGGGLGDLLGSVRGGGAGERGGAAPPGALSAAADWPCSPPWPLPPCRRPVGSPRCPRP